MTGQSDPIVCGGQNVDDSGTPVGHVCGKTFRPRGYASAVEQARAAGWRIAPNGDAMCPACARPDPAIAKGLDR